MRLRCFARKETRQRQSEEAHARACADVNGEAKLQVTSSTVEVFASLKWWLKSGKSKGFASGWHSVNAQRRGAPLPALEHPNVSAIRLQGAHVLPLTADLTACQTRGGPHAR